MVPYLLYHLHVKSRLSPQEQLQIVIEGLKDNVKIAEICRGEELWPNEYYRIKEKALPGALKALKRGEVYHQETRITI